MEKITQDKEENEVTRKRGGHMAPAFECSGLALGRPIRLYENKPLTERGGGRVGGRAPDTVTLQHFIRVSHILFQLLLNVVVCL